MADLEGIEVMRELTNDQFFGKLTENRLIWRELLDLELQDIEEEIERICIGGGPSPEPEGRRT
jgi:hypothetical protein